MNHEHTCAIWGTCAIETYGVPNHSAMICDSPRAGGKYWIGWRTQHLLQQTDIEWIDERLKARLTSWLIEQREAGEEVPKIRDFILNKMQTRPPLTMKERARSLLTYISNSLTDAADDFVLTGGAHQGWEMLAWSESTTQEQLNNVVQFLLDSEHLKMVSRTKFRLTAAGHEEIARGKENLGLDALPTEAHMLIGETEGKTQFLVKAFGEITQSLLTEDQKAGLRLSLATIRDELAGKYSHPQKVAYQTGFVRGALGTYENLLDASNPSPSEPETPA